MPVARPGPWTAWWVIIALLAATVASIWIQPGSYPAEIPVWITQAVLVCAFASVGALIASRRPSNPIGWLSLVTAFAFALAAAMLVYTELEINEQPLPGRPYAAWLATLGWLVGTIVPASFILLLFPTGRLPARRWRWVEALAVVGFALSFTRQLLSPTPLTGTWRSFENPFGISILEPAVDAIGPMGDVAILVALLGSIASLFVRLARGTGDERQQVKWLLYAAGLVPVAALGAELLRAVYGSTPVTAGASHALGAAALAGIPVAIGIAILRYRLYDIDIIINRTLVYGALTAVLAAGYFGGVALLQTLLPIEEESGIAVAASTLAIAALFRPLRARMQDFIDRRFYRSKYDAEQTIEAFSARLRDEVDLDELTEHLLEVVQTTMQPAKVSLWLRNPESQRPGAAAVVADGPGGVKSAMMTS